MAGTPQPTILALMAHPDDIEFQCAGTLCRLKSAGWRVVLGTMTHGDCGSVEMGPAEIAAIRTAEAHAAAALIGSEYHCLDLMDLFVLLNEASIKRCVELLRRVQPDVVITHSPEDYMLDHEQCSVIVRTATFGAPIRNLSTDAADPAPTLPKLPHLYYADPMEGMDKFGERIEPQFGIDITDVIELKERMLASHASQREWLLKHHGIDEYLLSMRHWGRVRGEEFGADYAEAFRQHLGHAYPHDNVIGDVLGSLTR